MKRDKHLLFRFANSDLDWTSNCPNTSIHFNTYKQKSKYGLLVCQDKRASQYTDKTAASVTDSHLGPIREQHGELKVELKRNWRMNKLTTRVMWLHVARSYRISACAVRRGSLNKQTCCVPQALSPNQPVQLSQGYNSTLSCEFFADPAGIVVWYRNGTRIQGHWPRMSVQQTQGRKFQSTLIIENVQLEDAGMYVCFLDTGHGRANTTFAVHVEPEKSNLGHMFSGSVFQWMNQLNTTLVLKYTGIAASCLIILLMFTGLIIYCLYGKRSCRHHEELQSSGKTDGLRKSSYDSLRDGHLTEKPNGKQIHPGNAPFGLDKHVRMPRSTLVSKSAIGSVDPQVFVSVPTSSDQTSGHMQVISATEPADNYLAIQIVPTEGKIEGPKTCSIHNYAIIQSVKPDGLLLHGVSGAPNTHAEGTLFESDRRADELTQNNANRFLTSPRMIRSSAEDYNFGSVRSSVAGIPTQLASSVDYVPCPLHGNIYATLQCTKKDTIATSKKHIATIPKGLGTVSERRTNTIPHRGKAFTTFTSSESGSVQSNPVSSFISAPEMAKSKVGD
ncbi:immunoglobulin domain protein [Opisthorchis viverrini]|uniref:Immunoglobulin domain protein n=1 Tax=Opisthorchis viverrini TaxID=6198 RepID=A0A1S8XB26_OPIVI|nr:immunoglobulin domain protein [Opisthorchis viverrini]